MCMRCELSLLYFARRASFSAFFDIPSSIDIFCSLNHNDYMILIHLPWYFIIGVKLFIEELCDNVFSVHNVLVVMAAGRQPSSRAGYTSNPGRTREAKREGWQRTDAVSLPEMPTVVPIDDSSRALLVQGSIEVIQPRVVACRGYFITSRAGGCSQRRRLLLPDNR